MSQKKALFLDRDGVINIDSGYTHKIEDFVFADGIFDLCLEAKKQNLEIVVITNQGGIGRGFYSEADFAKLTDWMIGEFAAAGIEIARVYHCPHLPVGELTGNQTECDCRKPKPGMLYLAAEELNINLADSFFIGDQESDMLAANNAKISHRWLVGSEASDVATNRFASLAELLDFLIQNRTELDSEK